MVKRAAVVAATYLFAAPALAAAPPPPLEPVGELPVPLPDDQALAHCMAALSPILAPLHNRLDAYVVSANRTWGAVLRADVSSSDSPPVHTRFVCPLKGGPLVIQVEPGVHLLTSGPWGEIQRGK